MTYIHYMDGDYYHIYPLGDHAITVELGNTIDPATNDRCLALAAKLESANIVGVKDIVPAYTSVSLVYDPVTILHQCHTASAYQYVRGKTEEILNHGDLSNILQHRLVEVPACFDVAMGTDLEALAAAKNLGVEEVIHLFISSTYRVYMLGFLPGFAYMGRVDDRIAMPRKPKPANIQPGSIGIAGLQAGIYPLASPGGWNIIGRTPLRLFDSSSEDCCLFKAGDEVVFKQISREEFDSF